VIKFLFELVSLGSGGGRIDEWCGGGVDGGGGLAFMSNGGALDKAGVRHGIRCWCFSFGVGEVL